MILWILAYLGGLLTILSPCILPVLPFVFSRAEKSFAKNGLPLLLGMVVTFAFFSTLAVLGGAWVVHANEWGRYLALLVLSLFALTLISPALSEKITHPLARLGGELNRAGSSGGSGGGSGAGAPGGKPGGTNDESFGRSFVIGVATGLLWAPCAGPILGLILTGAALNGASVATTTLLIAYALGAATSLGAALLAGGKLFKHMKKYLGADVWVRRVLGIFVLLGVLAIALGWDRGILTRISKVHTEGLEQMLIGRLRTSVDLQPKSAAVDASKLEDLPDFPGGLVWVNSPPLTRAGLAGKVVVIDFWTYSCINCLRSLPYVEAWARKYKDAGLVVIGVHTPEFAFEKSEANVRKAVGELGVTYPVVIDDDYAIWKAFHNSYWPAHYFVDANGKIRGHHFGEGDYDESEKMILTLLKERNGVNIPIRPAPIEMKGVQVQGSDEDDTPETYVGYDRAQNEVSEPPVIRDQPQTYRDPTKPLELNQWNLQGFWKVQAEDAELVRSPGMITFRFHARDLHLVLGPTKDGAPIHFRVKLDGKAPGENHGIDVDPSGRGVVKENRLYQLIRQMPGQEIRDHTFEIEFSDPGVRTFAFTFG